MIFFNLQLQLSRHNITCNHLAEVVLANNIEMWNLSVWNIVNYKTLSDDFFFNELPADLSITCGENWKTFCSRANFLHTSLTKH